MVIDELIVVLGLDPRKFNEGQRQALDAFKKTKEGATEFGKSMEGMGNKLSESFGIVRRGVLGVVGAIAGGEVAAFFDHVIKMDAATGRMAKSIGTSVQNLSTWQHMIRQLGGDASSATSALSTLQQEIENVRQGGGMFEGGFASLMNQAGVSLKDDADTVLRKIQSYISGQISSGRMRPEEAATFLRRVPGMNQDMINLMLADFQKIEEAAKKAGSASDENAKAAQKLQAGASLLVQSLERLASAAATLFVRGGTAFNEGLAGKKLDHVGDETKGTPGKRSSDAEREAWIRQMATSVGIDPDVAMRVARSEGFGTYSGDQGTSFGDFQLHLSRSGNAVGDAFRKATGLDPSDPANEKAMDLFALKWAAQHGWADFHGAARVGVGQFQGIGAGAAASSRGGAQRSSNTTTNDVDIHKIEIHAPNAKDADGISQEIGGALKRQSLIAPANNALV